jgi:hypothetical protein
VFAIACCGVDNHWRDVKWLAVGLCAGVLDLGCQVGLYGANLACCMRRIKIHKLKDFLDLLVMYTHRSVS